MTFQTKRKLRNELRAVREMKDRQIGALLEELKSAEDKLYALGFTKRNYDLVDNSSRWDLSTLNKGENA